MKDSFIHMVASLGTVTVISALILGLVADWTRGPIELARIEKQEKAIRAVSGSYDNEPVKEVYQVHKRRGDQHRFRKRHKRHYVQVPGDTIILDVYPVKENEKQKVTAIKSYSDKGYSGRIELMVGIDAEGKIVNIEVVSHQETPGLGSKIKEDAFIRQFIGQTLESMDFRVAKDGGEVDAISGATISSRAFSEAVKQALEAYNDTRDEERTDK